MYARQWWKHFRLVNSALPSLSRGMIFFLQSFFLDYRTSNFGLHLSHVQFTGFAFGRRQTWRIFFIAVGMSETDFRRKHHERFRKKINRLGAHGRSELCLVCTGKLNIFHESDKFVRDLVLLKYFLFHPKTQCTSGFVNNSPTKMIKCPDCRIRFCVGCKKVVSMKPFKNLMN